MIRRWTNLVDESVGERKKEKQVTKQPVAPMAGGSLALAVLELAGALKGYDL